MASWTLRRAKTQEPDDTHEPHLPHEEKGAWLSIGAVAAAAGAIIVGATLALFG
jgi:hypothetical protein